MTPANITELHGLEYRGYVLLIDRDDDGDKRKLSYEASKGGARTSLDWCPYAQYEPRHFRAMVKLGFPKRKGIVPLSPGRVDALACEAFTTQQGGQPA